MRVGKQWSLMGRVRGLLRKRISLYGQVESPLMDMVYSTRDYCVRCVGYSVIEAESIGDRQELHVLDEHTPTPGIRNLGTVLIFTFNNK